MQITIETDKPESLEVYKCMSVWCVYDADKKKLTFEANVADDKSWRLVCNDRGFIDLIEGQGTTTTIWNIFTGTKEECLKIMKEQGWEDAKLQR